MLVVVRQNMYISPSSAQLVALDKQCDGYDCCELAVVHARLV